MGHFTSVCLKRIKREKNEVSTVFIGHVGIKEENRQTDSVSEWVNDSSTEPEVNEFMGEPENNQAKKFRPNERKRPHYDRPPEPRKREWHPKKYYPLE